MSPIQINGGLENTKRLTRASGPANIKPAVPRTGNKSQIAQLLCSVIKAKPTKISTRLKIDMWLLNLNVKKLK